MEKGNIKTKGRIVAHGIQILNGSECSRSCKVPIILLDYDPPTSAHEYAKGEKFALWIKFEESEFRKYENQLNKDLREFTLWFDKENSDKLEKFLVARNGLKKFL